MIAEEAKTTITRENRFLKLDPAQRLEAVNQLVTEIKENPNPSEKLKQDYADSIIAFQHLISDLSTDKENPLDSQDASEFAQLFATHAEILAHNNILLPGNPEYKPANSETAATFTEVTTEYVRELVKINQELSKHTSGKKEPTAEEKKQYTDVLISFQHFLAKEYHLAKTQNPAAKLHANDFVIVEQSLKYFAVIVNRLAIFGIKLPTGEISASSTESSQVTAEQQAETPNESRANSMLDKFKGLVAEIKARYPGWSEAVQQTIARGITRFQESSRIRNEADLTKRKEKFLKDIEKGREKKLAKDKAESERIENIEAKLTKLNQGDEVKLLDSKGKTAEVHTVVSVDLNKQYLIVDIYYPNQKTRQKLEGRTRYFDYYTDLNNVATIDIKKKKSEGTQAQKEKQLALQKAKEQADAEKAKQLALQKAKEQADAERAKQLALQKAKEQADAEKAKQLALQKAKEQADAEEARQLALQKAKEQADAEKAKQLALQKAKEQAEAVAPLFSRQESKQKFGMDGSLLKAFQIGEQKFGIFKIYEDNRHCFIHQKDRYAVTGTDYFVVQFDNTLQISSYRSKGLRNGEPIVLGREQLNNRFDYADDNALSRTHVRIELVNGQPVITDLGSKNGTKLLTREQLTAPIPVKLQDVSPTKPPVEPAKEVLPNNQIAEIIGQNNELTLSQSVKKFKTRFGSEIAAGSDKGINYKDHNEDRVVVVPDKEFIAVVDGMGGYGGGDIAAQIIAQHLSKNPDNIQTALDNASAAINNAIQNEVIKNNKAGAPFISARIVRENGNIKLEYSYSGDCSLIVIDKKGKVKHIGKTDSYLNSPRYLAINNNVKLTDDQLLYHPQRNIVLKAIDRKNTQFTAETITIESGDRVILMSDGINDNLTPEELAAIVSNKSVQDAIFAVDQVTSARMQNASQIINDTPDRAKSGKFSDEYKSEPKKDNRGIAIIDVK